jgi:hypothetical protein
MYLRERDMKEWRLIGLELDVKCLSLEKPYEADLILYYYFYHEN